MKTNLYSIQFCLCLCLDLSNFVLISIRICVHIHLNLVREMMQLKAARANLHLYENLFLPIGCYWITETNWILSTLEYCKLWAPGEDIKNNNKAQNGGSIIHHQLQYHDIIEIVMIMRSWNRDALYFLLKLEAAAKVWNKMR